MTDDTPDSDRQPPQAPRPARPRPVPAPGPPTPVRSLVDTGGDEDTPSGAEEVPSAELEVDGSTWVVRVVGRAQGGPSSAPLPLLLLGFFRDGDSHSPAREALVVARSLAGLSYVQLEEAFGDAQPPPDPDAPRKTLFPEIGSKGNRRDG